MKIRQSIDAHKLLTFAIVLGLMYFYNNYTIEAWVYLALHGSYGLMWLIKSKLYPDPKWEEEVSVPLGIFTFFALGSYWIAPYLLISSKTAAHPALISACIVINLFGVLLHYTSDAQKYYTLKYRSGLIDEGFFASSRNPNYLGEILIYLSFAILAQHWLPLVILGGFVAGLFIPNMKAKDRSLARYPEFAAYKMRSGLIFPNFWTKKPVAGDRTDESKFTAAK
jgi:steroid 5-alpha reductase family enzyme